MDERNQGGYLVAGNSKPVFSATNNAGIHNIHTASGFPNCDIIWAGEMSHGGGPGATQAPWHQYIIDNADNSDVIGLSSLDDPRLGTFEQQITDGMRSDTAHITARGNTIQAEVWLDLLRNTSLPRAPSQTLTTMAPRTSSTTSPSAMRMQREI